MGISNAPGSILFLFKSQGAVGGAIWRSRGPLLKIYSIRCNTGVAESRAERMVLSAQSNRVKCKFGRPITVVTCSSATDRVRVCR